MKPKLTWKIIQTYIKGLFRKPFAFPTHLQPCILLWSWLYKFTTQIWPLQFNFHSKSPNQHQTPTHFSLPNLQSLKIPTTVTQQHRKPWNPNRSVSPKNRWNLWTSRFLVQSPCWTTFRNKAMRDNRRDLKFLNITDRTQYTQKRRNSDPNTSLTDWQPTD